MLRNADPLLGLNSFCLESARRVLALGFTLGDVLNESKLVEAPAVSEAFLLRRSSTLFSISANVNLDLFSIPGLLPLRLLMALSIS